MRYYLLSVLLILFSATCRNSKVGDKSSNEHKSTTMANVQSVNIKINELYPVSLHSRGAMGLQLMYRCSDESVVEVKRVEAKTGDTTSNNVGGPVPAIFNLRGLKAGKATVEFYETRPWDKDFKEIPDTSYEVVVNE